jgi:hypothetical protein
MVSIMDRIALRLDLLKLASTITRGYSEVIETARQFENYVTEPEAPASPQGTGAQAQGKAAGNRRA